MITTEDLSDLASLCWLSIYHAFCHLLASLPSSVLQRTKATVKQINLDIEICPKFETVPSRSLKILSILGFQWVIATDACLELDS